MSKIEDIEIKTRAYADARAAVNRIVESLRKDLEDARRKYIENLKTAVAHAADTHDELKSAIDSAPELFVKPKTITVAGFRVGLKKEKGKVIIDDEEKTIKRIRKLLPEDQAELLIRVTEKVHKPGVYDLEPSDHKRLGIKIESDIEAVFIKAVDNDTDKLVNALLKEAEQTGEAA